jgi:peptide/nickel transport system permease protein
MNRFAFFGRRLLLSVPVILGVMFVVVLLLSITPGDPARLIVGLRASEESVAQVRSDLGLDQSVFVQFAKYVGGVVQGDLGYSFKNRQEVSILVGERIEPTVWLLTMSILLSLLISVPVAIFAALRRDKAPDHVIRAFGLVGIGMPAFWFGLMLLLFVALPTGWFPIGGFGDTFWEKLRSVFLPALTLAIGTAPVLVRSLRASLIGVLDSDYILTARSLGMSQGRLIRKFAIRNASGAVVTILALEIGFLLFGAVVVEGVFAIPGLGQGLVEAALSRDLAAIQGFTLVFALAVIGTFLIADAVLVLLDPRIRIDA